MLTEVKVRNSKPKEKLYRLTDQNGLCLEIKTTGKKFWRYRYFLKSTHGMITIGEYPLVGLAEARTIHIELRKQVLNGENPVSNRRELQTKVMEENLNLFSIQAKKYLADKKEKRSVGYGNQIEQLLDAYILPHLGKMSMNKIEPIDIIDALDAIHRQIKNKGQHTGEVTVNNCKTHIAAIFTMAARSQRGLKNPALGIEGLERPPIDGARDLTNVELNKLLLNINKYQGTQSTKGVLWTMLYSMTRTKEARFMRWEHIDLDAALWSIPLAEISKRKAGVRNMKSDRPHIVPLSTQMVRLLKSAYSVGRPSGLVWPSMKDPSQPICSTTVNRALEYMGINDTSGHDLRATCSTMMNGKGFNADHIEMQLAHMDGSVRGVYNHARWLPERTEMLQWWADELDSRLDQVLKT